MDFSNQVIPVSESSGGAGSGLINGGRTFHRGVELAATADISQWLQANSFNLSWDMAVTRVDARFAADRYHGTGENRINIKNNKTPYSPEWMINSAINFQHNKGMLLRLSMSHTDEQFGDIANRVDPTPDGRIGLIPAYTLFNGCIGYKVDRLNTTFRITAHNLTNQRYIVTRRLRESVLVCQG
jgi:Fe(3+) dicitrate transport protein